MVLVWLNKVEVGSFAFREAILSVKLKLSGNNWIFTPAVHVKCRFSKNENTSIGKTVRNSATNSSTDMIITDVNCCSVIIARVDTATSTIRCLCSDASSGDISGKSIGEETISINYSVSACTT